MIHSIMEVVKSQAAQNAGRHGPEAKHSTSSRRKDEYELARAGKVQVLRRQFGLISMIGFGSICLATWEGVLSLFVVGFTNGGPAGLIYGFILAWVGVLSVFLTLAELASMIPTSGGQYHWTARLAPAPVQKSLSYVTGWLTVCNWMANLILAPFLVGNIIEGVISLCVPTYVPIAWHTVLISWALLLLAAGVNLFLSKILAKLEGAVLILHFVGYLAILIPVVYLSPNHVTATTVFTQFLNEGGWPSQGISFWVGLSSSAQIFSGADGIVHMTEETFNATMNIPRAIVATIIINGLLGFGMLLALLFTLPDINLLLQNTYGFPFIQSFLSSTSSVAGTAVMTSIVIILNFMSAFSVIATTSRMIWAFARDRGLPGWRRLQKVNAKTSIPTVPVLIAAGVAMLFQLISIGSSSVLNTIVGLGVCGSYGSYLVPAVLLLWSRLRSGIIFPYQGSLPVQHETSGHVNGQQLQVRQGPLTWGPWRLPASLGTINNTVAICWMVLAIFWSLWPSTLPVTAQNMNYSIVVTAGVATLSLGYYALQGRKTYKGPIVEQ